MQNQNRLDINENRKKWATREAGFVPITEENTKQKQS